MADRPVLIQELEITPEGVEAGLAVLRESGRMDYPADGPDQLLVVEIIEAVLSKYPNNLKIEKSYF